MLDKKNYDESLPYPWAKFEIKDEDLERYYDEEATMEISLKDTLINQTETDEDDDMLELIDEYRNASPGIRSVIDMTLVHICGWSLPSLLRIAEGDDVE